MFTITTVKFPLHIPVVPLKHTFSPANDSVEIDWSCQKSESHHNFPCVETYILCPTTSVLKSSTNFNNYAQQRHLEDVLAADSRWVIQSGTDGKLILNNDKPGLFYHP